MTLSPSVTIIILNYNRPFDTFECIESLKKIDYTPFHIILVDNCSTDNSVVIFREKLKDVNIYLTQENLGYTGGINFGLRIAEKFSSDYILLLNNDTIVEKNFLKNLVNAMENDKSAAAACGTILCEHKRDEIWYSSGKLIKWRGLAIHKLKGSNFSKLKFKTPVYTTFITGCMIILRDEFLKKIGYEDERFYMYLDDIEFSARIQQLGYKLVYVPDSIIYHKVLNESESSFKLYYSVRNRLLLISLISRGLLNKIATTYFLIVILLKLIYWRFFKLKFFKAAKNGLQDFFRNSFYKGRGFDHL